MNKIITYFLYLSVLSCFATKMYCQPGIDSLKRIISTSASDTTRIRALNRLAIIYGRNDFKNSEKYADSALKEIEMSDKKNGTIKFYDLEKCRAYTNFGNIYFKQGNSDASVEFCIKALKISEKYNENKNTARLLSNLGATLGRIGNNTEAKFYYTKASKMRELIYNAEKDNKRAKMDLASSYLNLGGTFIELYLYDSSLYYLKKSLVLLDTNEKTDPLGLTYMYLGGVYTELKDFEPAALYTKKAIDLYLSLDFPDKISNGYASLSGILYETKNYHKSLAYLDLAEKIDIKNSFNNDLVSIYRNKASVYEKLGDIGNELFYLKKHQELKDTLLQQNHNDQIIELQTQYETEKKEKEIIKLNKDNKIRELQLEKEIQTKNRLTIIIISVTLLIILLVVLTVFLIRTISERKKAYIKLQEKNVEIENQSEQLSHQAKLISRFQSRMTPHFIFNALNSIQGFVINDQKQKTVEQIQLFDSLMSETIDNSMQDDIKIRNEIAYLNKYIKFEQGKFAKKIKFNISMDLQDDFSIPPMLIQPFIENTIKHAGFHTINDPAIDLHFSKEDDLLKITISDNGIGFDTGNTTVFKNSHAIAMFRSRLQVIFSTFKIEMKPKYFEIHSKPELENGTVIRFYLPLIFKYEMYNS